MQNVPTIWLYLDHPPRRRELHLKQYSRFTFWSGNVRFTLATNCYQPGGVLGSSFGLRNSGRTGQSYRPHFKISLGPPPPLIRVTGPPLGENVTDPGRIPQNLIGGGGGSSSPFLPAREARREEIRVLVYFLKEILRKSLINQPGASPVVLLGQPGSPPPAPQN